MGRHYKRIGKQIKTSVVFISTLVLAASAYAVAADGGFKLKNGAVSLNGSEGAQESSINGNTDDVLAEESIATLTGSFSFASENGASAVGTAVVPYYDKVGYGWKKSALSWNYIDKNGVKVVDWLLDADGNWYFMNQQGEMKTGWIDWKGQKYFLEDSGKMHRGWLIAEDGIYYFRPENGDMFVGFNVIDGCIYQFGTDGKLFTGWQTYGEAEYFYDPVSGQAARGIVLIDGVQYGFDNSGKLDDSVIPWNLRLVNYENPIPTGFKISLKKVGGYNVDVRIADALSAMVAAAKNDKVTLKITSGYRTIATQERLYNNRLNSNILAGLSYEKALYQTRLYQAEPGKSEHNLGLAIDFISGSSLNNSFAYSAAGIWLKEHAHEYGFILRYEAEKTDITHIVYEPWHYRYVGVEAACEIHDAGICLEEFYQSYVSVAAQQ